MTKTKTKRLVNEKGYYEILEISPHATTIEIQRSFERLCEEKVDLENQDNLLRKQSAEELYTLTKAYEILTDPFERLNYDERLFYDKLPINNQVETIFKEGLRAFKSKDLEGGIRFFKEAVYLFPHKSLYRVHLAIAYAEKGWKDYAEKELRTALRLDPNNEFSQEVVAKVLFNVSDRKRIPFLQNRLYVEISVVVIIALLGTSFWYVGGSKVKSFIAKSIETKKDEKGDKNKIEELKNSLPQDLRQAIEKKGANYKQPKNATKMLSIAKLSDDFKPQGQVYDYTAQKPIKRTYYPDQGLIMIDYESGNVLSYKAQDVLGWKVDPQSQKPVIITKTNEIIPVSVDIPITLSDGRVMKVGDAGFPNNIFPEYGGSDKEVKDNKNNPVSANKQSEVVNEPQSNNSDTNTALPPISQDLNKTQETKKGDLPPLPPISNTKQ